MKKILFFAMLLGASMMAITSCKKDKDKEPEVLDPAALLNTSWRTDSVKENGVQQPAPHFYLQILGTPGKAIINTDTVEYSFEGQTLICRGYKYEVTSYTGTTAVLNIDGLQIFVSKMPEFGTQYKEPKSADFVGTWKLAYYSSSSHMITGEVWFNLGTNPGVETWELRANGSATYHNTFTKVTKNGTWSYEYGMIMVNNPAEAILEGPDDRITVQPLTTNWMGFVRGDGTTYYMWYFVRVK